MKNKRPRFANPVSQIVLSAGIACVSNLSASGSVSEAGVNDARGSSNDRQWNVIFIMADDLGWKDLSCYGSELHETPHLDRFARQGMKFTNAYSAAALSSPTRAALLTGKYPARLHMTTWFEQAGVPAPNQHQKLLGPATTGNLPLNEYSVAKAFKDAGYFTAHVGKWHVGDALHFPEAHGFDVNIGSTVWGAPYSYWYPFKGWRTRDEFRYIANLENLHHENENAYLTDRLTDEAIRLIQAKREEPFLLYLSYYTPHTPLEGKPDYVDYFRKKVDPGMQQRNPVYAAMIRSLDENVGRVLKEVELNGIAERTIIVFYSDNGGALAANSNNNHPLRAGKGTLYEGGIRVPLMVYWPGKTPAGSITDYPVSTMDFYPTLIDMAGIEGKEINHAGFDGISLAGLLRDTADKPGRDALFWHFPHYYFRPAGTAPQSAIRKGNWKLIHFYETNRLELYDLEKDITETYELSADFPEITKELYQELRNWRREVNAQHPTWNPNYLPEAWKMPVEDSNQ